MSRSDLGRIASVLFVALVVVLVAACKTNQESFCENVGNCEHGGSSDFIQGCKDEAKLLKSDADGTGCGATFDAYVECADSSFECHGATAVFPGCEGELVSLDECLAKATASTSCAALASRTSTCGDGGAGTALPPACTAMRDCEARCFLDSVHDVCAPAVDELSSFSRCASQCPTR